MIRSNHAVFWTIAMVIEPLYSNWTIVSSLSCTYQKITTKPHQQENETGLAGREAWWIWLTATYREGLSKMKYKNGDDLGRHLPPLP